MKNILVAMSGGVDSSVAALLLKQQGHSVSGAYIKTWRNEDFVFAPCPWQEDIDEAREAAEMIGIEFSVVNMMKDYREHVVEYLVDGYQRGNTPNPDIICNREIKFGAFLKHALNKGFDGVATGHYCRKTTNSAGACELFEGLDKNKDQSYFLTFVRQDQLRHAHFPLGDLTKTDVRQLARNNGLANADKKDSQGICFLGRVRINDFLEQFIPEKPGSIIDPSGKILGQHKGLHRYTNGQRKGIGIASNTEHKNYVVVAKDISENRLVVDFDTPDSPGLYTQCRQLHRLSFIDKAITQPTCLLAKPRFRDPSQEITFIPDSNDCATVEFAKPQRALAIGQVCVLYDGEKLLGGGVYC